MADNRKGLAFPLRMGPLGHLERSSGDRKIIDNAKAIVLTERGERVMRPSFGMTAARAVFGKMGPLLRVLTDNLVREAIVQGMRDVRAIGVDVQVEDHHKVVVDVRLAVTGANRELDFTVEPN